MTPARKTSRAPELLQPGGKRPALNEQEQPEHREHGVLACQLVEHTERERVSDHPGEWRRRSVRDCGWKLATGMHSHKQDDAYVRSAACVDVVPGDCRPGISHWSVWGTALGWFRSANSYPLSLSICHCHSSLAGAERFEGALASTPGRFR